MASIGFSESNGIGPTVTDGVASIQFANADFASISGVAFNHQINPGANSFEKWLRAQVTGTAPTGFTAFSVYFDDVVADHVGGANITVKYGVNGAYAAPVATASAVATTDCATDQTSPGVNVNAPANTLHAYSGYITLQAIVGAAAAVGAATFPADFLSLLFAWN